MKVKELRQLGPEELGQKLKSMKKELFDLNYLRKFGRVEKPSRFRLLKRDIARILTFLNEKDTQELASSLPQK